MEDFNTFGDFLKSIRVDKGESFRELAAILNVSATYISDLEKGRRNIPSTELLDAIAQHYDLSTEDKNKMYDLIAIQNNIVAPDIPEYIHENGYVAVALRKARELNATEGEWEEFLEELRKRRG